MAASCVVKGNMVCVQMRMVCKRVPISPLLSKLFSNTNYDLTTDARASSCKCIRIHKRMRLG